MNIFLWGGAISACQSEGAYDRDGRTASIFDTLPLASEGRWDIYKHPEHALKTEYSFYPSHEAINFYDNYKEDLKLLAELGIKAFRTSISWSRIFPTLDGEVNEEGVQFYIDLFTECRHLGMEPIVTLCHFDTPLYLTKAFDGWYSRQIIPYFLQYAELMLKKLKGLVRYWLPINEVNMILHIPYLGGGMVKTDEISTYQAAHHMLLGSAQFTQLAHDIDSNNQVGCMLAAGVYYPYSCNPTDVAAAQKENRKAYLFTDVQIRGSYPTWFQQGSFIQANDLQTLAKNTVDFVAISYYSTRVAAGEETVSETVDGNAAKTLRNPNLEITPWGRQIDPLGLKTTLIDLYDRYQLPIFIVENGLGAEDALINGEVQDDYRIEFMQQHIYSLRETMREGVEVMGYLVWGIIDVISAGGGEIEKRYGLIHVDQQNDGTGSKKRTPKKSFYWYQQLIQEYTD
ncbi:family 1 glycosylhydrolase [Enterococcus saccharolyticus]|uniref:glycoside hydrolase family 1 protein n=1 Tax=Enterococcus saccharolyticus TaxID=41997 RepID=UPI001E33FD5F|nr:family 1 glycosylhydrolase [Enterococcus saccharolyticus]MCD5003075.1 family 1 glycosylhydrolase [Enterococcus saccharolyticus]